MLLLIIGLPEGDLIGALTLVYIKIDKQLPNYSTNPRIKKS
jgi:hypothetical protein